MTKTRVRTLNAISGTGLTRFPAERYEVGESVSEPDALLVRSAKLHDTPIPDSVLAIARAGAGTNNIPVDAMTARGIPVFNTPGANANAVKELVLGALFLAARGLIPAADFAAHLEGTDTEIAKATEAGKKQFVGFELPGKTLGVVGLGAIGVRVANAALSLGLKVVGYDPQISVDHAWHLSAEVQRAESMEEVFRRADILTIHVPALESTRNLVSTQRLAMMKHSAIILNFARAEVVDETAILSALDQGYLAGYVCDFPSAAINAHPGCLALPHLGASTKEAERNCAVMAVDELRGFLEDGQIHNSVNLPEAVMAREPGTARLVIVNDNVPNMVGQVTGLLAQRGLNIANLLNRSRGAVAVTLVDVDAAAVASPLLASHSSASGISDAGSPTSLAVGSLSDLVDAVAAISGVIRVRLIPAQTSDGVPAPLVRRLPAAVAESGGPAATGTLAASEPATDSTSQVAGPAALAAASSDSLETR